MRSCCCCVDFIYLYSVVGEVVNLNCLLLCVSTVEKGFFLCVEMFLVHFVFCEWNGVFLHLEAPEKCQHLKRDLRFINIGLPEMCAKQPSNRVL